MSSEPKTPRLVLPEQFGNIYHEMDGVPVFKLFIGGKWVESSSGKRINIDTPIDGTVIAGVQAATKDEVNLAIEAAFSARKSMRSTPAIDRVNLINKARHIMEDYKEVFVNALVLEAGKPAKMAEGEFKAALNRIKMTMEEARAHFGEYIPGDWSEDTMQKFALVVREPLGVVAAISPFNYPLFSVVSKVAPALLCGNTVVIKPASEDPIVALLLARVLQEAGIPEGSVNLVTGSGREVGDTLVSSDKVAMITLTGSTEVGKHVASIAGMKKMHLELGGKGAAVVAKDADLQLAVKKVLEGSLKYSGQRCDAINRVFVEKEVSDAFVSAAAEAMDAWKLGDPRDPAVTMGPLINEEAAEHVQELVDDAVEKGASVLRGGKHDRWYFEPTLLVNVPPDARIAQEETFGPVVTVISVDSIQDAIEIINGSRYGLDSCVFTKDFYTAWRVVKALEEGSVSFNDAPAHGVGYFPFGGNKDSGIGREGIGYSIDEMTKIKTIQFNLAPGGLGKTHQKP